MKKLILISSIAIIAICQLMPLALANAQFVPLKKGMRSEEVKAIQQILREDPNVYLEGYVTGYFGPLTEEAVKRLQKKFEIPVTGIIDEATEKIIFPYFDIKVTSPNGGEYWQKGETHAISWKVLQPLIEGMEAEVFWPIVSVDLYKREQTPFFPGEELEEMMTYRSVFVRHLGSANLFDGYFKWRIGSDIPSGTNYLIRISTGRRIAPCILFPGLGGETSCRQESASEKPVNETPPSLYYPLVWDESDMPFAISGETPPCPPCSCPVCPNVKTSIEILQQAITELAKLSKDIEKAIAILKAIPTQ